MVMRLIALLFICCMAGCVRSGSESGFEAAALDLRLAVGEVFVFWRPDPGMEPTAGDTTSVGPGSGCSEARPKRRSLPAPAMRRTRLRLFPIFKRNRR